MKVGKSHADVCYGTPGIILAAALGTDCTRRRRYPGMPVKVALPYSLILTAQATLPASLSLTMHGSDRRMLRI